MYQSQIKLNKESICTLQIIMADPWDKPFNIIVLNKYGLGIQFWDSMK